MSDPGTPAPPHRLKSSDLLDIIERLTTRTATEPSASVEITRNAKDDVQFSVKVYAGSSADAAAVEAATSRAYDQAVQAFDSLTTKYPRDEA